MNCAFVASPSCLRTFSTTGTISSSTLADQRHSFRRLLCALAGPASTAPFPRSPNHPRRSWHTRRPLPERGNTS